MEKELIFNVSNEIQLISIIREIYESGYDIIEYTVNKIENKNYDMSNTVKSEKQCGECDMRFHCNPRHYSLK